MAHLRSRAITCGRCGQQSFIVANLDDGRIQSLTLTDKCIFPAICQRQFVEGVFDRQFCERIIKPKFGGMSK